MSWRLYGRIKLRNSSPVCPQDWDTNKVTSFCASAKSQNTYWQFYNNFANQDYCQMDAGSSVFGSDITMDLFLYKKTWKVFKTSPQKPRQAVQCTPIVDDASIPALYADLDCVESRVCSFLHKFTRAHARPHTRFRPCARSCMQLESDKV